MKIILLADKEQKEELLLRNGDIPQDLTWTDKLASFQTDTEADACIDLLFDGSAERIYELRRLKPAIIIVNSVVSPLRKYGADVVRINGWNTFLKNEIIEAAGDDSLKRKAEIVFSTITKKVEWVPDVAGFISARIVASIINEAYFALEENVSSREAIDAAMKLGTNYPFGPFEWGQKIGLQNIYALLKNLSAAEKRYEPALLLTKEATL